MKFKSDSSRSRSDGVKHKYMGTRGRSSCLHSPASPDEYVLDTNLAISELAIRQ